MPVEPCTGETNWDVIQAAPINSQATGVLAAVVFAGVILLFGARPSGSFIPYWTRALILLLYVFFEFVVVTFLYVIIAGESSCNRAVMGDAFATALLVTGAAAMLLALCWLTATYCADQPERPVMWVKVFAVLLILTVWVYLEVTLLDSADAIGYTRIVGNSWIVFWMGLLVALLIIVARLRSQWRCALSRQAVRLFTLTLFASVTVAAFALGGFAYLTAFNRALEDVVRWWTWWHFATMAAVTSLIGLYLVNLVIIKSVTAESATQ